MNESQENCQSGTSNIDNDLLFSNNSDYEDDCVYCKDCGEEMEWQECWSCGGEGGRGWEDLQFEDPLWYSPDDFIDCDVCEGKSGMWICPNKNCYKSGAENTTKID